MRQRVGKIIIIILLFTPSVVCARVSFSEIAWMGVASANGQYGEWIELYNDGTEESLAGWQLYSGGGSDLLFTLSKTIPSGGYLLVERTTASMPDPVPGVDDEHGSFGAGGLSNAGEHLVLKDATGTTVEALNYSSGWPAGDASTKETMQRSASGWITASPTPKEAPPGSDQGTGDQTDESITPASTPSSKKSEPIRHEPYIRIDAPGELYQYVSHTFSADVVLEDGLHHKSGPVRWNMGDGTFIEQRALEPVIHRYLYPGTYTIWLGFYRSAFDTEPILSTTKIVRVGTPALSISVISSDALEITNQSGSVVDLSLWNIVVGADRVPLPPHTLLASDASITLRASTLGLTSVAGAEIARPEGELLAITRPPILSKREGQVTDTEEVSVVKGDADVWASDTMLAQAPPIRNHTKQIVFGVIASILVVLFILLERFMAKRE